VHWIIDYERTVSSWCFAFCFNVGMF